MVKTKGSAPTPFRSGLYHGFLSVAVFGLVGAFIGGVIHIMGDPAAAGPSHEVALFQSVDGDVPPLRARANNENTLSLASVRGRELSADAADNEEPSLGVPDPDGEVRFADAPRLAARGVRINGKLVNPGQSYSEVEQGSAAVLEEPVVAPVVEAPTEPAKDEAETPSYARAFANPDNRPVVGLVIGGLGTSERQAISAIDDLPPEVTLSFVPDAKASLLRYARKKGHEVLMEVPMESHGYGRTRPHRHTLLSNAPAEDNIDRLDAVLRGKKEVYGVINHLGDKFIAAEGTTQPIMAHLEERGLAFFRHGTVRSGTLDEEAANLGVNYAAASTNIDTETDGAQIEAELFRLETEALDAGYALGTGFSYPLSVDLVAVWSQRLRDKGILLAPASAVAKAAAADDTVRTSRLRLAVGASTSLDAP